jgi:hypothetical protein
VGKFFNGDVLLSAMRPSEEMDFADEEECVSIAKSMIEEIDAFDYPKAGRSKGHAKRNLLRKVKMAKQMSQSVV